MAKLMLPANDIVLILMLYRGQQFSVLFADRIFKSGGGRHVENLLFT